MSSEISSRSEVGKEVGNWLGPIIAYSSMLAVSLLFGIIASPFHIRGEVLAVIEQWVMYALPLLIIFLHITRFEGREDLWETVGVRKKNGFDSFVWAFALFVVFSAILALYWQGAISVFGIDPRDVIQTQFEGFPNWYFGYMLFASFFPVAFFEELIFRGFVLDRFLSKGPILAIVLSSLLFSSLHLWYAGFGFIGLPMFGGVFILAVNWSLVYWKTRSIIGVVIIHGLHNSTTYLEQLFGSGFSSFVSSIMFIVGILCLGYVLFDYLKDTFEEIRDLVGGSEEISKVTC